MNITNEDKIALLEFLGYSVENNILFDSNNHYLCELEEYINDFNPLDISILIKALDIIEETHHTNLNSFSYNSGEPFSQYECKITKFTNTATIYGYSRIREEAILKAVLEYIKTTK